MAIFKEYGWNDVGKFIDLTGKRFGRLVAISLANKINYRYMWNCECDCGNKVIVGRTELRTGDTKSCGCLHLEIVRKEKGLSAFNAIYGSYKNSARIRKLEFLLTKNEFLQMSSEYCFYCGIEPKQIKECEGKNGMFVYNGIDRLDSSLGYFPENCVPCCGRCNEAKMSQTQNDFYHGLIEFIKI